MSVRKFNKCVKAFRSFGVGLRKAADRCAKHLSPKYYKISIPDKTTMETNDEFMGRLFCLCFIIILLIIGVGLIIKFCF